jgi:hypothetical protein
MDFLDDVVSYVNVLRLLGCHNDILEYIHRVFAAIREVRMLDIFLLADNNPVIANKLTFHPKKIAAIIADSQDPTKDCQFFTDFTSFNSNPDGRVWISVSNAMEHAQRTVRPVELLNDTVWVANCIRLFSHLLAVQRRHEPFIDAAIFLLHQGQGITSTNLVLGSPYAQEHARQHGLSDTVAFLLQTTPGQKVAMHEWLQSLDKYS